MRTLSLLALLCTLLPGQSADPDTDGDGLPDFREIHKYRTDPKKPDTDGDGIPDGDWDERREWTYTLRTIVRVMPLPGLDAICDDQQDARVLSRTARFVELEVIHYPLNTAGSAIGSRRQWRSDVAALTAWTKTTPACNWDEAMRKDVIRSLAKDGIQVDELDDRALVERVSAWAMSRSRSNGLFTTYHVHFPDGRPAIFPGLEDDFRRRKVDPSWTDKEVFARDCLGKGMYERRTRGSCTSSAVYLATLLRALGMPTRIVLAIPAVDASDTKQLGQLNRHVRHHHVRNIALGTIRQLGGSFAAHTYNEVWVNGRWRRLNYARLGQPNLDANCMGLLTHVHVARDLSDLGLAASWGKRYVKGERDAEFKGSNPYRALVVSDRFGVHGEIDNPGPPPVLRITRAYWFHSEERPTNIPADAFDENDGSGHVLVHVEYDGSWHQMNDVYDRVDRTFALVAPGQKSVPAFAAVGCWGREFYLRIPPEALKTMTRGVAYRLVAANGSKGWKWGVGPGVTLKRE